MLGCVVPTALFAVSWAFQAPTFASRVVIVTTQPLPSESRQRLAGQKSDASIESFSKQGFVRFEKDRSIYLFEPKLWAKDAIEDRVAIWQQLSKAIQPDGTLDLASAPKVAEYARAGFLQTMGLSLGSDSKLSIDTHSSMTLSDGKSTRTLSIANDRTADQRASLKGSPLRPAASPANSQKATAGLGVSELPGALTAPEAVSVFAPGPGAMNAALRMRDLAEATEILAERYEASQNDQRAAKRSLLERFKTLNPFSGLEQDMAYDRMPEMLREKVQTSVVGNFAKLGFHDENEARVWLSSAHVSGTQVQWLVTGAVSGNGSGPDYVAFGLP